jgi:hypothetical protein
VRPSRREASGGGRRERALPGALFSSGPFKWTLGERKLIAGTETPWTSCWSTSRSSGSTSSGGCRSWVDRARSMSSGSGRQANFQDDSPPSVTGGQPNRGATLVDCASGRMEGLGNAAPFTDELKVAGPAQRARSSAFLDCWNGGHDLIWRRRHLRQSISSLALKRPVAPTLSPPVALHLPEQT